MNDEIREILEHLKNEYWRNFPEDGIPYKVLYAEEVDSLLDYIINLQQENEELNKMCELYSKSLYCAELTDYKSRIEKAVDYIKEHIQKYDIDGSIGDFDEFDMLTKPNYLLNILQNGSDEE